MKVKVTLADGYQNVVSDMVANIGLTEQRSKMVQSLWESLQVHAKEGLKEVRTVDDAIAYGVRWDKTFKRFAQLQRLCNSIGNVSIPTKNGQESTFRQAAVFLKRLADLEAFQSEIDWYSHWVLDCDDNEDDNEDDN
jgi:hypothetical protein